VVREFRGAVSLDGGDVGSIDIGLQNQLDLVNTSVEGRRTRGEGVLVDSRRDRHLEANGVIHGKRDRLNAGFVRDTSSETRSSFASDLAQQLAREVGRGVLGVGGILAGRSTVGSRGHVDGIEGSLDITESSSALGDKVRKKIVFIAKQIHAVRGVEELLGEVADKVVLDEVLLLSDIATGGQDGIRRKCVSVSRVQLQVGGPVAHINVILNVGSISVVDIKRVGLELKDGPHIRQLHVVNSNAADIEGDRSFTSELTGNAEGKSLVKAGKSEIHHFFLLYYY
jgi:hypothetical protein